MNLKKNHPLLALVLGLAFLMGTIPTAAAGEKTKLEILFMNHGPMQPTIRALQSLLQTYADAVEAQWYDVDQDSGKAFMKQHQITGHIPLLILVDGSATRTVGAKTVTFQGFPTGAGPYQFQGQWSLEDLSALLLQLKSGRP